MTLTRALAEVMRLDTVVIGTDFDGTLAPIVEHPDLAVPDRRAVDSLRALARMPGVEVVVVSGRSLSDLRERLGEIPGVSLIGEHGNDIGVEEPKPEVLKEAIALIGELGKATPGSTVEIKQRSVTFHTRRVAAPLADDALAALRDWAAGHAGITVLEGKEVLELSVGTRTKADAVLEVGAEADAIIFIGDDRTDETVFERLHPEDVGVKVGEGDTAARFRVDDVAAVADLLETLVFSR
ncbi:MAG: trehalose-phosphatase [Acidimicrobiia bacterium]